MKLMVTGGAGFIGSAVVRKAIMSGFKVLNIDALTYAACPSNLRSVSNDGNYTFLNLNICDYDALEKAIHDFQPDAIMHLAAESHVDRSIYGPEAFINTNVIGTFNLLMASKSFWDSVGNPDGFRFHHISTDEVFGTLSDDPSEKFEETTAYDPRSPYSASKASSDHLVRAWYHTYGLPTIITNCSNNYGPFHFPEKLIPLTIINALRWKPLTVYGNGTHVRDWLHVEDHVEALLLCLTSGTPGRSYNIGGGNERSNIEIVNTICKILDQVRPTNQTSYKSLIQFVNDRPGHDQRYAINGSRITSELGWEPKIGIKEGLESTVEWYMTNESWWAPLLKKRAIIEHSE